MWQYIGYSSASNQSILTLDNDLFEDMLKVARKLELLVIPEREPNTTIRLDGLGLLFDALKEMPDKELSAWVYDRLREAQEKKGRQEQRPS